MSDAAFDSVTTFGDLLTQFRARKHGLSLARLANLAGYDKAILVRMGQGQKDLTGPSGRERVVRLMSVLRDEGALTTLEEANALLAAARMPPLFAGQPDEAALIQTLRMGHPPATAHAAMDTHPIRHNLPAQLTRFIGREREVEEVSRLVRANRLVTLTGVGGVGKTRLAIEVGAASLGVPHSPPQRDRAEPGGSAVPPPAFEDGVWLAELAPLTEPALVPRVVAEVFKLQDESGRTTAQALGMYLQDKSLLLILDNCEHLVGACAVLAEALLRACPRLRLLATSRELLHVPGEVTWRVPSLTTPDPLHLPPPEQLLDFEAVRLFVEHATAAQPDFQLTPRNASAVAQVCAHLDGIPLAIEMAAAWAEALSVEDIAARLGRSNKKNARSTINWCNGINSSRSRTVHEDRAGVDGQRATAIYGAHGESTGTRG